MWASNLKFSYKFLLFKIPRNITKAILSELSIDNLTILIGAIKHKLIWYKGSITKFQKPASLMKNRGNFWWENFLIWFLKTSSNKTNKKSNFLSKNASNKSDSWAFSQLPWKLLSYFKVLILFSWGCTSSLAEFGQYVTLWTEGRML